MNAPLVQLFSSETEYRSVIDQVLSLAQREICLFDSDLGRLRLDVKDRAAQLEAFIADNEQRRLRVIVHETTVLDSASPRLRELIRRFPLRIEIRRSPESSRHLSDCLLLADGCHGVIRFHSDHARGKQVLFDATELTGRIQRFEELWLLSEPLALGTVLGT